MCSDLINRGTIVLLKLLFNYFVFLHAWLLGTLYQVSFSYMFFMFVIDLCLRSYRKREPIDGDSDLIKAPRPPHINKKNSRLEHGLWFRLPRVIQRLWLRAVAAGPTSI